MLSDLEWLALIWVFVSALQGFSLEINFVTMRARRFLKRLRVVRSHLGFLYSPCKGLAWK